MTSFWESMSLSLAQTARTQTCVLCPRPMPADDMCRHARWLCHFCCIDHCDPEDER